VYICLDLLRDMSSIPDMFPSRKYMSCLIKIKYNIYEFDIIRQKVQSSDMLLKYVQHMTKK